MQLHTPAIYTLRPLCTRNSISVTRIAGHTLPSCLHHFSNLHDLLLCSRVLHLAVRALLAQLSSTWTAKLPSQMKLATAAPLLQLDLPQTSAALHGQPALTMQQQQNHTAAKPVAGFLHQVPSQTAAVMTTAQGRCLLTWASSGRWTGIMAAAISSKSSSRRRSRGHRSRRKAQQMKVIKQQVLL